MGYGATVFGWVGKMQSFLTLIRKRSIWLDMVRQSTSLNFMREVVSMEAYLGNTGMELMLTSERNSVHCAATAS